MGALSVSSGFAMQNTNPATPTTPYKIDNPEEFARNMLHLFEE